MATITANLSLTKPAQTDETNMLDDFNDNMDLIDAGVALTDQTFYIGTTQVAINRASAGLTLTGITLTAPDIGTPGAGVLTNCTFPTLNQNTTGTATNVSGTPALPNGTTATTQSASDNSTKLATTAYADAAAAAGGASAALDNLASVAINTSLISDTADTDSLGSATIEWLNLYIGDAGKIFLGLGQDLSIHRSAANTMTLTASSGVVCSAGLTVAGDLILGANSIGRDADNDINFETDNRIMFRTNGVDGMEIISSGELDMNANSVGFTIQSTTGDGTTTIDWRLGNKFKFTFGAQNETFTFTAPTNPCTLMLTLIQDATGSRTVTWPATVKWPSGTAPTLTTAANSRDKIALDWDGAQYDGVASLAFS